MTTPPAPPWADTPAAGRGGVLRDELLQERRHPRRRERRGIHRPDPGGPSAVAIAMLVQRKQATQEHAGFRVDQMHLAQIPGSDPQMQSFQVSVARGHLEADPGHGQRAVGAALGADQFRRKAQGHRRCIRGRATDIRGLLVRRQGALAQFRVFPAVVFHLDPRLGRVVELAQRQVGHALEHWQEPALDLAPEVFLLPVLVRGVRQGRLVEDAQPRQPLGGLGRQHGAAVVAH